MSTIPESFAERLDAAFKGRLRIRWSDARKEYQLEQKVGRALSSFPVSSTNDDSIRLRDGYLYILSIRPGTRMPCPRCTTTLEVPVREIRELSCPLCKLKGREHRVSAGYFPLDDQLIDYLKRLDPERDASWSIRSQVDQHNTAILEAQRAKVIHAAESAANDDFNRIAGIPSVGYTGKEQAWLPS